jgi:hypothetical protein
MADINEEFLRAQEEAARSLQRLGAVFQTAAGAFGNATGTVKASAQSVGQGLIRLRSDLDRGRVGYRDATQELRKLEQHLESLDDTVIDAVTKQRLADQQKQIGASLFREAIGGIATDLTKLSIASLIKYQINQLTTGVKAIQENAGGASMAFQLQNQALTNQIAILGDFERRLGEAATTLALIPNPLARAASIISGVGSGLAGLLAKAKDLQLKGFTVLQTEILKSQESFKVMTGAGALFTGGITEIRDAASRANLDLKELSIITAQNSEVFARLGGSVSGGVKRFADVNAALGKNRLELLNLGYSYEQQAQASVDYMDRLQQSGQLLNQSPEKLAQGTAEYLKHLKAVSALTGEDEKRLKQRQAQAREQAAVQAMLREAGGDAAQKFDDLVGQFPGYERAIQQLFTIGTVTDPVLATVLANNQELDQALRQGVENVRNNNIDAKSAQQQTELYVRQNAEVLKRNADENAKMYGTVALINGGLQGQADLSIQTFKTAQRAGQAQKEGSDLSLDAVGKMAKTTDALTTEIGKAEKAFRETASKFNSDILPILSDFATKGLGGFKGLSDSIKEADKIIRSAIETFTGRPFDGDLSEQQRRARQQAQERDERIERETPGIGTQGDEVRQGASYTTTSPDTQLAAARVESQPVSMSLVNLSEDSGNRFKDSFVQAMVAYQQQRASAGTTSTGTDTLASVTDTLRDVFSGQNGFNQVVVQLKDQLATDSGKQIAVLQKQADKLENLLLAMQDNVDYSKRIADNIA